MPKVSVIIPTYNRAYIVNNAIGSVLSQSLSDLEVLVIDDGSTDNTNSVIKNVNDTRVQYYHKKNGGVSSARNFGMAKAQGQFIAFLDSDDLWPDNFIETLLAKLQTNPEYGLAYCATAELYPDGKKTEPKHIERCVSGKITKELFKNSFIWPMAVLIKSKVLKNFCFDEALKTSDDNDAFLRLSVKTQFVFVPDIEVIRRCSS
ncbi:MAG: glycosyltransferase family 2 protein, partial [Planctomycetes bacterium]|nr:glycosyltransferase family 2 protein [Planctomycetota bacterium]